jgi:major membrane immunogen (membrane-anchored lipoprotein)
MKKVVIAVVVCMSLLLGACKDKLVSTTYTIGCLGYQYGAVNPSDWQAIEDYMSSNVTYNKLVTFENKTVTENDAEASAYFDTQMAKVDTAYVCSLMEGNDYYIYGIATQNTDGSYRYIKAMKFSENGAVGISE